MLYFVESTSAEHCLLTEQLHGRKYLNNLGSIIMADSISNTTQTRLKQALESLDEAKALLAQDAAGNFVMNYLYYAILYSLCALLESQDISTSQHSKVVSLFEQDFVLTGKIERRFYDAIRQIVDLRPNCECKVNRHVTS